MGISGQCLPCLQEPHRIEGDTPGDTPEPHGVSSASSHLCKLVTKPASTTSSAHSKQKQHTTPGAFKKISQIIIIIFFRLHFHVSKKEKKIYGSGASPEAGTLNKIPCTRRCSRQWQAQLLLCLCSTLQKTERALSAQQSKKIFVVT